MFSRSFLVTRVSGLRLVSGFVLVAAQGGEKGCPFVHGEVWRECAVRSAVERVVTVTGAGVVLRDIITVGGHDHAVVDMRVLPGGRRKLVFDDGNVYVVADAATVQVKRLLPPPVRRSAGLPLRGERQGPPPR